MQAEEKDAEAEKDDETEKELKKIMAKNFPDFSKDINVKVQVQWIPKEDNLKEVHIKKQKIREKLNFITYSEKTI